MPRLSAGVRAAMLAGAVGVLIVVALLAARVSPWSARPPAPLPKISIKITPTNLPTLRPPSAGAGGGGGIPSWLVIAIGALLLVGLLVMLALWWARRTPRTADEDDGDDGDDGEQDEDTDPPIEPERPHPHGELSFDARQAADRVIAAWERVEQAATAAGEPRSPEQTPTEFLTELAARTGANRTAIDRLLDLFHHARFEVRTLRPGSAEQAEWAAGGICSAIGTRVASSAVPAGSPLVDSGAPTPVTGMLPDAGRWAPPPGARSPGAPPPGARSPGAAPPGARSAGGDR